MKVGWLVCKCPKVAGFEVPGDIQAGYITNWSQHNGDRFIANKRTPQEYRWRVQAPGEQ